MNENFKPKKVKLEENNLSIEEKNIVEKIEDLTTNNEAKMMIILTWKGLKPLSEFSLEKYHNENDEKRIEQNLKAEKLFKELGLFSYKKQTEREGRIFEKNGSSKFTIFYEDKYYISKKLEDLTYFINHFGKEETKDITKKLGDILGYPESAINAWSSDNRTLSLLPRKHELYNHDEMAFRSFRFSKTNYKEEFKTIKKWAEEIKRLDLRLYNDIVRNHRMFISENANKTT